MRAGCGVADCMNPEHWEIGWEQRTGRRERARLTGRERKRFVALYRTAQQPMRMLTRMFGIEERAGWALVGLTDQVLEERYARQVYLAQREEERSVARQERTERRELERDARDRMMAREVCFDCEECGRLAPVDADADVAMVSFSASQITFAATNALRCAWCGTPWKELAYAWTQEPVDEEVARHLRGKHRPRFDVSARPIAKFDGHAYYHGVGIDVGVRCNCAAEATWSFRRWKSKSEGEP